MTLNKLSINGKSIKVDFKKLFFPILLFIVVIIVLLKFSELREIGKILAQTKWYWILAALISQYINFTLQTSVYYSSFKILKLPFIKFSKLFKTAFTIMFLNLTIPSLGFAGNVWFLKKLKKCGIKEGKSLLTIIIEFSCYYIAFVILLIFSLVFLFIRLGSFDNTQKIAIAIFCGWILIIAGIVYFFLGSKKRAKKRLFWLAQRLDKIEDGIQQEERVKELLDDFYADFEWIKKNKAKLLIPIIIQLFKFLFDGLTIFLIFLSLGHPVSFGLCVVAFCVGKLFSLITVLPGGIGLVEGSMVVILIALGVNFEVSIATTLIYRLFSYWIYMPLGLTFYKQLENNNLSMIEEKSC